MLMAITSGVNLCTMTKFVTFNGKEMFGILQPWNVQTSKEGLDSSELMTTTNAEWNLKMLHPKVYY